MTHPRPGRATTRAAAAVLTVAALSALAAGCGHGRGAGGGQPTSRPAGQPGSPATGGPPGAPQGGGGGSTGPTGPTVTLADPTRGRPAGAGTAGSGTSTTSGITGRAIRVLSPAEGATVGRTFGLRLDVTGFALREPNGDLDGSTGHLYVVVDGAPPPPNRPVRPGSGPMRLTAERTTLRNLRPGRHTITVVGANGYTVPFSPPVTATRTVNVRG